jgi:hypothetical protein
LNDTFVPSTLDGFHKFSHEFGSLIVGDSRLSETKVRRVIEELRVVGTDVEDDGESLLQKMFEG